MDPRRRLPAIDRLLRDVPELPRTLAVQEARVLVETVRSGGPVPVDWTAALRERVAAVRAPHLRRVINATGVVLHTNLGRAPLSAAAAAAVGELAQGYVNLELDLETGERGERLGGVRGPLATLTGAEAAVVVNNNAAAVLLMLTALAAGREVIVSRGELVEIGGAFRVPDVISAGGARLVEVGTTNRTRLADYAAAIGPGTAAILRVHPSNFRVVGFAEAADRSELARLAHERGIWYLEDLGAGALVDGLGEPAVAEVVAAGADVVCFSGDKLLGGPQSGVAVGRADLIGRLRGHALYRALRLDRLVLVALEATLRGYLVGELPPVVRMLQADTTELSRRAGRWQQRLRSAGVAAVVRQDHGVVGGGSLPGETLAGPVVDVSAPAVDRVAAALRAGDPAVVARIRDGVLHLDPRTVRPEEDEELLARVCAVAAGGR